MLDMVFEHRNKAYGAYVLRRDYNKSLKQAIFSILSVVTVFCFGNFIRENMKGSTGFQKKHDIIANTTDVGKITPPAQKVKPRIHPPPPPQHAAAIPTIANTERRVVTDNHVTRDSIPAIRQLENAESGTTTNATATATIGSTDGTGHDKVFEVAREVQPAAPTIYNWTEEMPEFPGGEKALMSFIASHIEYPQMERDNDIQGRVTAQFTVNEDGTVSDIQILKGPSQGLNREATRVIKMFPTFRPGRQQGRAVKVRFNLPLVFRLN